MFKLRQMLSLTPREICRLARGRLPLLRGGPAWTTTELMASAKHRNGIRFAELLMRQEAILKQQIGWQPLQFEGKRVVEIGCGPLGGYGPLAIFCGAASYESSDPEWDEDLFNSEEVANRYLYVLYADLVALYGERMDFDSFRRALRDKLEIHHTDFDEAPISEKADIVLSQSCLEHVFPLEGTIGKLAEIQGPKTRFLHLVDFGNHYLSGNPFDGLYEQPPEDYIARRGKAINLMRACDVINLFNAKEIPAHVIPSRIVQETYRGTIHPWWRERYDDQDLFTQLALVAGPAT